MSGRVSKAGIAGFALTLALAIPVLFILSRNVVSANQFILIVCGVLALVLWTVVYLKLVDPLLRRGAGTLFGVPIEWQYRASSVPSVWSPVEPRGCLFEVLIELVGYFFLALWLTPFAAAIGLVLWLRH